MAVSTGQLEKLFISNLSNLAQPDDLKILFSAYGTVLECVVNKKEGDKGFAFIKFDSHSAAAKAKDGLDGTMLHKRNMKVKWAIPQSVITVHDLEPIITNDMLVEAFTQFGQVESAVVATDPITRRSKGYAFITFAKRGSSKKALSQCEGGLFLVGPTWRPVRVEATQFDEQEEGVKENVYSGLEIKAHFAQPGTAEFDFALKWRDLSKTQKQEEGEYKERHNSQIIKMKQLQESAMQAEAENRARMEAAQAAAANYYPPYYNPSSSSSIYPSPSNLNNFPPLNNYPPPAYPPTDGYTPTSLFPPTQGHAGPMRRRDGPFSPPNPNHNNFANNNNSIYPPHPPNNFPPNNLQSNNNINNTNNHYPPQHNPSHPLLPNPSHPPNNIYPQSYPPSPSSSPSLSHSHPHHSHHSHHSYHPHPHHPPHIPRHSSPSPSPSFPLPYPPHPHHPPSHPHPHPHHPHPAYARGGSMGIRSAPYHKHR